MTDEMQKKFLQFAADFCILKNKFCRSDTKSNDNLNKKLKIRIK